MRMMTIQCVVEERGVRCPSKAMLPWGGEVGGWLCPNHDEVYAWMSQVGQDQLFVAGALRKRLESDRNDGSSRQVKSVMVGWKEVRRYGPPINDTLLIRASETKEPESVLPTRRDYKKFFPGHGGR